MHMTNLTHGALCNKLARILDSRSPPVIERHKTRYAPLRYRITQRSRLRAVSAEGLFAIDMLASGRASRPDGHVKIWRRTDIDDIDLIILQDRRPVACPSRNPPTTSGPLGQIVANVRDDLHGGKYLVGIDMRDKAISTIVQHAHKASAYERDAKTFLAITPPAPVGVHIFPRSPIPQE